MIASTLTTAVRRHLTTACTTRPHASLPSSVTASSPLSISALRAFHGAGLLTRVAPSRTLARLSTAAGRGVGSGVPAAFLLPRVSTRVPLTTIARLLRTSAPRGGAGTAAATARCLRCAGPSRRTLHTAASTRSRALPQARRVLLRRDLQLAQGVRRFASRSERRVVIRRGGSSGGQNGGQGPSLLQTVRGRVWQPTSMVSRSQYMDCAQILFGAAAIGLVVVVVSFGLVIITVLGVVVVCTLLYARFFPVRHPMLVMLKEFMKASRAARKVLHTVVPFPYQGLPHEDAGLCSL